MKTYILLAILLLAALPQPQAQGSQSPAMAGQAAIKAVVIGISDYLNIPDLQYAHRDAEAFAGWLQSEAGGNLPAGNIHLLLDSAATLGRVAMALDWLMTESREGDKVIIYFSGHGDVEKKMFGQPGYLLCRDAPAAVYMSGGTLSVGALQEVVATLTLVQKAQVVLITDACRAGALAGSTIGGPQMTSAALQERFGNTVRILSCQPNEYSLEGRQWGGGRGAFSYHLVEGLYGFADQDADQLIKLKEIGRYLEDHVPRETDPQLQNPVVLGDREARLAVVSEPLLAARKAMREGGQPGFYSGEMKSLAGLPVDSSVQEVYDAFLAAVTAGRLMDAPEGERSANECYDILVRDTSIASLHGFIKRHFVAALVDESQEVTNKLLVSDPQAVSDVLLRPFVFEHIPGYLDRATGILGQSHFLYRILKAKQYYFEGLNCTTDHYPGLAADSLYHLYMEKMKTALAYDSIAAYVHFQLGFDHLWRFPDHMAARQYSVQALELSPNWAPAQVYAGWAIYFGKDWKESEAHYLKSLELDPGYLVPYEALLRFHKYMLGDTAKANYYADQYVQGYQQILLTHPEQITILDRLYLGSVLFHVGDYKAAAEVFEVCAELTDHQHGWPYQYLGAIYFRLGEFQKALVATQKQVELYPFNPEGYMQLANCYNYLRQYDKTIEALEPIVDQLSQKEETSFFQFYKAVIFQKMGKAFLSLGRVEEAKIYFQKALNHVPDNHQLPEYFLVFFPIKSQAQLLLGDAEAMQRNIEEALQAVPGDGDVLYVIACLYAFAHREEQALYFLGQAFKSGIGDINPILIQQDPDLDSIRDTEGFNALMEQYFPKGE